MSGSTAQPLDPLKWIGIPTVLVIVATLVFLVPLRVFGHRLPEPIFAMVPAFAWALIRPSVLAPFALLGLGVAIDLMLGTPLGLWAIALLVAYSVIFAARTILVGQDLWVMWFWFSLACLVAEGVAYLFVQIALQSYASPFAMAWQVLATVLLYPLAHILIDRFEDADVRFR